jgi:hypothetical protein
MAGRIEVLYSNFRHEVMVFEAGDDRVLFTITDLPLDVDTDDYSLVQYVEDNYDDVLDDLIG